MTTEKPDGYVMWREGEIITLNDCSTRELGAINNKVGSYARRSDPEEIIEAYQRVLADGWRIRPVKLTFLDQYPVTSVVCAQDEALPPKEGVAGPFLDEEQK